MGFDKCTVTCVYHYCITQNRFAALKIPCAPPTHPIILIFKQFSIVQSVLFPPPSTLHPLSSLRFKQLLIQTNVTAMKTSNFDITILI